MILYRKPWEHPSNNYPWTADYQGRMVEETPGHQLDSIFARVNCKVEANRLTGEAVAFDWMKRRIQPLQARVNFGFKYQGTSDLSRCSDKEISNGEALRRVQQLFEKVEHVPHLLETFSALNPPKEVCEKQTM